MRIELNAGGLSGGIAVQSFQNDLKKVSKKIDDVVGAFQTVKKKTNNLTGGVGKLQSALSGIESRIKTDAKKQEGVGVAQERVGSFIDLALKVDAEAAACVTKNEKALFEKYPALKPVLPEEKKWYEEIWKVIALSPVGYVVTKLMDNYVRKNIGDRSISEFIFDTLHDAVDGAANFIKKTYELYEDTIGRVRDGIVTGLLAFGGAVVTTIASVGVAAIESVKLLVGGAIDVVKTVGPAVVTGLKKVGSAIMEGAKKVGSALVDIGKKVWKSVGPVVKIIGGIAAIAGCIAAAPATAIAVAGAVLVGVYAVNTIVNSTVDLYNVWIGDPDKVGDTNILKSGITWVTGGIGSLFGQKEFGIKVGNVLYAVGEITTVFINFHNIYDQLSQLPVRAPTFAGTMKNIGTLGKNMIKDIPEGLKGLGYVFTQTNPLDWAYQLKMLSYTLPNINFVLKGVPDAVKIIGDIGDGFDKIGNYVDFGKLPGGDFILSLIDFSSMKEIFDTGDKLDEIGDLMKAFAL